MNDIVETAKNGDKESFNRLITTYTPGLKAMLLSLVDEATASDIIQDTWLTVFTHLKDFKQQSHFKTWLYRITINKAKIHFKSAWVQKMHSEPDSLDERFDIHGSWQKSPEPWGMESPEALLEQQELACLIRTELENLPNNQRLVLILHDIEQLSFDEICAMLEISQSNAFVLIHRARKALYERIERFLLTGRSLVQL